MKAIQKVLKAIGEETRTPERIAAFLRGVPDILLEIHNHDINNPSDQKKLLVIYSTIDVATDLIGHEDLHGVKKAIRAKFEARFSSEEGEIKENIEKQNFGVIEALLEQDGFDLIGFVG